MRVCVCERVRARPLKKQSVCSSLNEKQRESASFKLYRIQGRSDYAERLFYMQLDYFTYIKKRSLYVQ